MSNSDLKIANKSPKQKKMVQGFPVVIDPRILSDYKTMSMLNRYRKAGDTSITDDERAEYAAYGFDVLDRIYGVKQLDKIIAHIEKMNDGFAPFEKVMEFMNATYETFKVKNS